VIFRLRRILVGTLWSGILRIAELIISTLFQRADKAVLKGLAWTTILVTLTVASIQLAIRSAGVELQYFFLTAIQLVGVILAVLGVVSGVTWATIRLFQSLGQPILQSQSVFFVGWHFLRSHREPESEQMGFQGGAKVGSRWVPACGIILFLVALASNTLDWSSLLHPATIQADAASIDHHLTLDYLLGHLSVAGTALSNGAIILGVILITWPLRPHRRTGSTSYLDQKRINLKKTDSGTQRVTATTFISIVGVGVGVWALVVVLSVMGGFESDLRSKILATTPHVLIQDNEPMVGIPNIQSTLKQLQEVDGVEASIPYVQGEVIISSRENRNVSLSLKGISWHTLRGGSHHLNKTIIAGDALNLIKPERMVSTSRWSIEEKDDSDSPKGHKKETQDDDEINPSALPGVNAVSSIVDEGIRPGILLGAELADSLQVEVGNEVTIISPQDGVGFLGVQPKARSFRVAGIFRTGMYEFDLKLAYCDLSEAQRFFHLDSQVNRIELRLTDVAQSGAILKKVNQRISNPNLEVLDWKKLNKNLFSALQLEKIVMFVVLAFIVLVASFNIVGSLIMIILEKAKEIAILKSMGATAKNTRNVFLVVGGFIGVIGSVAGLLVGLGTCWFIHNIGIKLPRQYYIEMLPVHVDSTTILTVFVSGILICMLATVYPAVQAARLRPVEGLRFD